MVIVSPIMEMIKTEGWTGGAEEEYQTQHFGFGSQRLKIAVRQMVEQKITNGVKEMESSLQNSLDLNDTDKATLTKSCDQLIRLYCERAGPSLTNIDCEIDKILNIPANVLLPGDECQQEHKVTDSEYESLKEEVSNLRRRIERGALMEALLTAEQDEISTVEGICETAKKDMEVLDLIFKSNDNNCKATVSDTAFLCASVNFMKDKNDFAL